MPLTGRFRFRRSLTGSVILQLEHETGALWPLSMAGRRRHTWRDARIVDLLQPQMHGLLELEHFVEEFPAANHGALAVPLARRRISPGGTTAGGPLCRPEAGRSPWGRLASAAACRLPESREWQRTGGGRARRHLSMGVGT